MNEFMAARKRLHVYAKELHELADDIDSESDDLEMMRTELLTHCASVADEMEATAETRGGKEAAAEIGRRIRALMEGTR